MTVLEVSRLTGVTVRTLQYYDRIGLLPPAERTGAGYRLYDAAALERLQQILLFRELEFPLKQIRAVLESPAFDRQKALEQQITLLEMKRQRLEGLIAMAKRTLGGDGMDFTPFDNSKLEEYAARAKAQWGETDAYKEYERKSRGRSREQERALGEGLMEIFRRFGEIRSLPPESREAQGLVEELQSYISAHYYPCPDGMLANLGRMYAAGGELTENIDAAGGEGTAFFAARAIEVRCEGRS